jgi:hypothetical protein
MHTKNGGLCRLRSTAARRSRVGFYCAQASTLAACARLLDIPETPYVAEPTTAPELGVGSVSDPDALEDRHGTSTDAGGAAPPPFDGELANAARDTGDRSGTEATGSSVDGSDTDAGSGIGPATLGDASTTAPPAPLCEGGGSAIPNGNCYSVITALLAWPAARDRCRSLGTGWDLAAVHDAETNRLLAGLVTGEAWIGGSDAQQEGLWQWVRDGVEFWSGSETGGPIDDAFNNWNSDEPNGEDGSNCVRMVPETTRWADLECEELRLAICEGPAL